MRVGLVSPTRHSTDQQMPLGIGYLASYLRSKRPDLEICVLDTGVSNSDEIARFMQKHYDLLGFSVTSRTFREAVDLAQQHRASCDAGAVVFGGPHVSIMPEQVLEEACVDWAVRGEGEETLCELVQVCEREAKRDTAVLSSVRGLIWRDGARIVQNAARPLLKDLDALPFPAFDLFPMHRYIGKLPMITSRGCPFACVFCASSQIWGRRWRARSPENILSEVRYLIDAYGATPIDFHDDGFNMSLRRVTRICSLFIEQGIRVPWGIRGFRVDIVNADVARLMRRAGCSHVAIGIESANAEMLVRMGKKVRPDQIRTGIAHLRRAGIDVIGQFMIGNPGETLATVRESVLFAQSSGLTKAVFGTAVPFPGTALWEYVEQEGRFLVDRDVTRFDEMDPRIIFETPEFLREERLEAINLVAAAGFMDNERRRRSLRAALLKRLLFSHMFRILPSRLAYRLYFLLRVVRRYWYGKPPAVQPPTGNS